jgi:hypothetical protein
LNEVDTSNGFAALISIKDSAGVVATRKAAEMSAAVLRKFLLPKIEEVVNDETFVVQLRVKSFFLFSCCCCLLFVTHAHTLTIFTIAT